MRDLDRLPRRYVAYSPELLAYWRERLTKELGHVPSHGVVVAEIERRREQLHQEAQRSERAGAGGRESASGGAVGEAARPAAGDPMRVQRGPATSSASVPSASTAATRRRWFVTRLGHLLRAVMRGERAA